MFRIVTKSLLSASICLATLMPVSAAQVVPQKPVVQFSQNTDVVQVRDHRRNARRHDRRGYYNGHRGYRKHRRGYRQHNGYWFPPAAFALGAIIGGALSEGGSHNVRPGYMNPQHVRWCDAKYRSYRARDNSFQPYHGPRRECRSPYY
jgi:hypothetical protein